MRMRRFAGSSSGEAAPTRKKENGMDKESGWQILERFLAGEMSSADLEQWLYATSEAESILGARAYAELLSFDFRQPHAAQELPKLVRSVYEYTRPGRLARDRAFRIAQGLLSGSVEIPSGVRVLAELCLDGHDWVPSVFVNMQSKFDEMPKPDQYAQISKSYQPSILDAAREIVSSYREEYGS
jgi:hypothetical protein